MHALIVVAHPEPNSLTHAVASRIIAGVRSDPAHNAELADLAAEGFDPRFTVTDLGVHLQQVERSADVIAEQDRIDRADALVLVYPVYWWSMPGLLKGWIDRVFTNGWAYHYAAAGDSTEKLLQGRVAHLVGIGAGDAGTYMRHGYLSAMQTQIDHGIFDYCGMRVVTSEFLLDSHADDQTGNLQAAHAIGKSLFDPTRRDPARRQLATVG